MVITQLQVNNGKYSPNMPDIVGEDWRSGEVTSSISPGHH